MSTKLSKLCIDCKYVSIITHHGSYYCNRKAPVFTEDFVEGVRVITLRERAFEQRNSIDESACGNDGKYWEPKLWYRIKEYVSKFLNFMFEPT